MPRLRSLLIAAAVVAAFVAGYKLQPRLTAERLYTAYAKYVKQQPSHKYGPGEVIDPVMSTDFARLIELHTPQQVAAKRAAMAAYVFRGGEAGLGRLPDAVERDVSFPPLADLKLAGIDVLTVTMPWGVDSQVYFLRAAQPRSCLMIYQEGHQVSFLNQKHFLERMTEAGCDVLALSLPLTGGINARPLISHPRFGGIQLNDADDLQVLDSAGRSSLAYFLEPLAAALNHALAHGGYQRVGATGFSGGGWAVQVFAALDPRVQATYSVAGSVPISVHAAKPDWGSPEQRQGRFYEIVNYPELYVMDADRAGRRHVQFYNQTDPCCFSGDNWQAWVEPVRQRIEHLGGSYAIVTYTAGQHTLTPAVAAAIADDFLGDGQSLPASLSGR